MNKMQPIYGTTMSGTETILSKWLNGSKEAAVKFLMMCITVNKPDTPKNNEQMAKETIEKWIEYNF
jgi:predicted metal-binding protein